MSHPDPCFDPDNSYEDDEMATHFDDYQYDYHDDFYGEDIASSHPDADHEVESQFEDGPTLSVLLTSSFPVTIRFGQMLSSLDK
jgi:hypothetical protein